MEHTKAYQEFKKNGNTKFVRYSEGAEMYHMSVSKFMQMAKDAKAIYKLGQLVLVNLKIFDVVLCQDLVQVKMRNFSHFNPPEAQPQCVFFYTIVRIHLVTYSYNGYEFVSYCRKLPDIRKSSGMPACNREF